MRFSGISTQDEFAHLLQQCNHLIGAVGDESTQPVKDAVRAALTGVTRSGEEGCRSPATNAQKQQMRELICLFLTSKALKEPLMTASMAPSLGERNDGHRMMQAALTLVRNCIDGAQDLFGPETLQQWIQDAALNNTLSLTEKAYAGSAPWLMSHLLNRCSRLAWLPFKDQLHDLLVDLWTIFLDRYPRFAKAIAKDLFDVLSYALERVMQPDQLSPLTLMKHTARAFFDDRVSSITLLQTGLALPVEALTTCFQLYQAVAFEAAIDEVMPTVLEHALTLLTMPTKEDVSVAKLAALQCIAQRLNGTIRCSATEIALVRDGFADPTWYPTLEEHPTLFRSVLAILQSLTPLSVASYVPMGLTAAWPSHLRRTSAIPLWHAYRQNYKIDMTEKEDEFIRKALRDPDAMAQRPLIVAILTEKLKSDLASRRMLGEAEAEQMALTDRHLYLHHYLVMEEDILKTCRDLLSQPSTTAMSHEIEEHCLYAFGLADVLLAASHEAFLAHFKAGALLSALAELLLRYILDAKETSERFAMLHVLLPHVLQTLSAYLCREEAVILPVHLHLALVPLFATLLASPSLPGFPGQTLTLLSRACGHPEWSHVRPARLAAFSSSLSKGVTILAKVKGVDDRLCHAILLHLSRHAETCSLAWEALPDLMTGGRWSVEQKQDAMRLWRMTPEQLEETSLMALAILQKMPCILAGTRSTSGECVICQGTEGLKKGEGIPLATWEMLVPFLNARLAPAVQVAAVAAMRSAYEHCPRNALNLSLPENAPILQLISAADPIRLASLSLLGIFMAEANFAGSAHVLRTNRDLLRDKIQQLRKPDHHHPRLQRAQSWMMLTSYVAQHCQDVEICGDLLKSLMYYLHGDPPQQPRWIMTATEEMTTCLKALQSSTPFWAAVESDVARFLLTFREKEPARFEKALACLGRTPAAFWSRHKAVAVPDAVIRQDKATLAYLASMTRDEVEVLVVTHVVDIFSRAFMELNATEMDEMVKFLNGCMPNSERRDLNGWLRVMGGRLLARFARDMGDPDPETASRADRALKLTCHMLYGKTATDEHIALEKGVSDIFVSFLDQFSRVQEGESVAERRQYVKACQKLMEEVPVVGAIYIDQMLAALQLPLSDPETMATAFTVLQQCIRALPALLLTPLTMNLVMMIRTATAKDPDPPTFVLQTLTLLFDRGAQIPAMAQSLSLISLPPSPAYDTLRETLRQRFPAPQDRWVYLERILHAMRNENQQNVEQVLVILKGYLLEHGESIQSAMIDDVTPPLVSALIDALLTIPTKITNRRQTSDLLSECLGCIGAVEPSKLASLLPDQDAAQQPLEEQLDPFKSAESAAAFASALLQDRLAKMFRYRGHPQRQNRAAFAVQEVLHFLGFREIAPLLDQSANVNRASLNKKQKSVLDQWMAIPANLRTLFEPYLSTCFSHQVDTKVILPPFFEQFQGFPKWICNWCAHLIDTSPSPLAKGVFSACRPLIKGLDTDLAKLALPILVLEALKVGDAGAIDVEISSILLAQQSSPEITSITELVFVLLEKAADWVRQEESALDGRRRAFASARKTDGKQSRSNTLTPQQEALFLQENADVIQRVQHVKSYLDSIPQRLLSNAALRCANYPRALMHLETDLQLRRETMAPAELQRAYGELQRIYAHVNEADGMAGIFTQIAKPSIGQQILDHSIAGRWTEAQAGHEVALHRLTDRQSQPKKRRVAHDNVEVVDLEHSSDAEEVEAEGDSQDYHHVGVIQCLRELGHFETMSTYVQGLRETSTLPTEALNGFAMEAAWSLSKWNTVGDLLNEPLEESFETAIGRILAPQPRVTQLQPSTSTALRHLDQPMSNAYRHLVNTITQFGSASYPRSYQVVSKMHILYEIQQALNVLDPSTGRREKFLELLSTWQRRAALIQDQYTFQEPLFRTRRVLLALLAPVMSSPFGIRIKHELSALWLASAKSARKANYIQSAYSALLQAEALHSPLAWLEKAKWYYAQGKTQRAMADLMKLVSLIDKGEIFLQGQGPSATTDSQGIHRDALDPDHLKAKALLLYNKWSESRDIEVSETIQKRYTQIYNLRPKWDKALIQTGRFFNRFYEAEKRNYEIRAGQADSKSAEIAYINMTEYMNKVIKYFAAALLQGSQRVYQTFPRLLTLWLDYVPFQRTAPGATTGHSKQVVDIYHKRRASMNRTVENLLGEIAPYTIMSVLPQLLSRIAHPDDAIFHLMGLAIEKVLQVYPQQVLWNMMSSTKAQDDNRAKKCKRIIEITKGRQTPNFARIAQQSSSLGDHLLSICNHPVAPGTAQLSISKEFRPLQRAGAFGIIVPTQAAMMVRLPLRAGQEDFHPFPDQEVTIAGFRDGMDIMPSLQHPRKITIIGSDGKDYLFLCKPKDDLRKDCRTMEFNTIVNRLLRKDPNGRMRQLHIRTYSVIPLDETNGLIEWVPNTVGFRPSILKKYKAMKWVTPAARMKEFQHAQPGQHMRLFKALEQDYPSVFYEFFLDHFPDPTAWFNARLAYQRTLAVMSMVGYVIGLGDRHGENILFDTTTGDAVHVDFNCLFEKGATFEIPERVPFRMTRNLRDALGVCGVEGVFRRCCEVTMNILRTNQELLLNVLETFLHDPSVEWSERQNRVLHDHSRRIQLAQKSHHTIARKLSGRLSAQGAILSVEGQVDELIRMAINPELLCLMYIGWSPFL